MSRIPFAFLTQSETALSKNITNEPDEVATVNLYRIIDIVGSLMDCFPIVISSGYRSPKLNAEVGGSATSAHLDGFAVDFVLDPNYRDLPKDQGAYRTLALQIFTHLTKINYPFDQIIDEHNHVHVGFGPKCRNEFKTI